MNLEQVFLALVNRSLAATWIVAAVLVLRLALRRAPKWTRCLLWALVAVRLVFSLSIPSSWSAFNLVDTPVNEAGVIEYAEYWGQGVKPVASFERPTIAVSPDAPEGRPPVTVEREQELVYLPPLSRLWLAGVAAMLGYALVSYLRLRRRVAASIPLCGNVFRCDGVDSPFILGVFRPRVYVPSGLDGAQLDHVLAHERAHLARRDHWWKPFAFTLLSIYWFNPALWLAYVLLCRDIELACDERVYRDMALAERADYSQTLLDQSCARFRVAACPLAFGEVSVKERVKAALHYKKPAFWVLVAAVIVCAAAAVCLLTNPQTLRVNFARDDILRVEAFHQETVEDVGVRQLDGLPEDIYEGIASLKGVRRGSYAGMTPLYTLTLYVEQRGFFQIRGYNADGTMTEIYYQDGAANKGRTWLVGDDAFGVRVMRLCRYGEEAQLSRWYADLDGDGAAEQITADLSALTHDGTARLRLLDAGGEPLCELGEIGLAHVGWRTLALCELDGRTYLLEYSPAMFQGEAAYRYELDELYDGVFRVIEQGSVAFSANPGKAADNDAEAMRRFQQRANELWSASRLLLTTDQEVLTHLYDAQGAAVSDGGKGWYAAAPDETVRYCETMQSPTSALIVEYDNKMLSQADLDTLGKEYSFTAVRNFGRGDLFSAYFDEPLTDAAAQELIARLSAEPGILRAVAARQASADASGGVPGAVRVWVDHYREDVMWEDVQKTELPELPGVTFTYSPGEIRIEDVSGGRSHSISGMPVWNAFFADLTLDGVPELCATVSFGSGMVDEHVAVFDAAAWKEYELWDRGTYDYVLSAEDGGLTVRRYAYPHSNGAPEARGTLRLDGGRLAFVLLVQQWLAPGHAADEPYRFTAEVVGYGNDTLRVRVLDSGDSGLSVGQELYVPVAESYDAYPKGSVFNFTCTGVIRIDADGNYGVDHPSAIAPKEPAPASAAPVQTAAPVPEAPAADESMVVVIDLNDYEGGV